MLKLEDFDQSIIEPSKIFGGYKVVGRTVAYGNTWEDREYSNGDVVCDIYAGKD